MAQLRGTLLLMLTLQEQLVLKVQQVQSAQQAQLAQLEPKAQQVPQVQLERQAHRVTSAQLEQLEPKAQRVPQVQLEQLAQLGQLALQAQQAQQVLAFWLVSVLNRVVTLLQSEILTSLLQSVRQVQLLCRLQCLLQMTKSTFNRLVLANLHLHKALVLQSPQLERLLQLLKQEHGILLAL
jgi:hypothetical protein